MLKRCDKECLEGQKNGAKNCRPFTLSGRQVTKLDELKERYHGWAAKQVKKSILKKGNIKYHHTSIYNILRKSGLNKRYI